MEKERLKKYGDIAMMVVATTVFGFIMYFACQVAYAILKAIF
jgi:hypothetical protein